jgi:hypothetical protein
MPIPLIAYLGAAGLGAYFLLRKKPEAPAGATAATDPRGAAAVLAATAPAQQPAIQAALNAGAPPADIQAALNAGIAPATIAVVAQQAQTAGGDVADKMIAFAAAHPNATDAEIQAAGAAP